MTTHELQLLATGAGLGSNLTLLLWIVLDHVSDWQARRRSAQSRKVKETVADLRPESVSESGHEPHPAELVEASVRDFELTLHDGLDRTEDTLRRDGLL